jgi:hypothetical protein
MLTAPTFEMSERPPLADLLFPKVPDDVKRKVL